LPVWWPAGAHLSRAALAVATIFAVGASVGLCGAFIAVPDSTAFLVSNETPVGARNALLVSMLAGALLPALAATVAVLRGDVRRLDALDSAARVASPLVVAGFLPPLFAFRAWHDRPLTFLVLLGAVALAAEQLLDRSFRAAPDYLREGWIARATATRWSRHLPLALVAAAGLGYAVYFSHYTIVQHRRFGTYGFDLGINVNWCFNALQGHPLRCTVLFGPDGGNFISNHAIFAMALWLPIYALKPGAEILLVYQATMVGLAAIPLYLFGRTQLPRWTAVLVAFAYLVYAPLHGPNFYDYHELLVALPFHFLLYWAIATKRFRWAALMAVIIWAHREDMAVGLVLLGAFLVLSGNRARFGLVLAASSFVWFLIIKFAIMPSAGSWWFVDIYKELLPEGVRKSYGSVVQTILINPAFFLSTLLRQDKLVYFLHLFASLAFLPLRRWLLILLALPGFFFTLMTTGYRPTIEIGFQYTTHWVPYLFAATVLALRLLGQKLGAERRAAAACAGLLAVTAHSTVFGAILQHEEFVGGWSRVVFQESANDRARYEGFLALTRLIPPEASVAASEMEVPHVAARANAYTLKGAHGDADYLLIRKGGAYDVSIVKAALERNSYGLVSKYEDQFFLFKRGLESAETAPALAQLGIRPPRARRK
jgi:uncharacterized membrane protein